MEESQKLAADANTKVQQLEKAPAGRFADPAIDVNKQQHWLVVLRFNLKDYFFPLAFEMVG